jgi:hypothetical protein
VLPTERVLGHGVQIGQGAVGQAQDRMFTLGKQFVFDDRRSRGDLTEASGFPAPRVYQSARLVNLEKLSRAVLPGTTSTRYSPPTTASKVATVPIQCVVFSGSTRKLHTVSGPAAIATLRLMVVSVVFDMIPSSSSPRVRLPKVTTLGQ